MTLYHELLALVVFTVLIIGLLVGFVCLDALVDRHIDVLFKN